MTPPDWASQRVANSECGMCPDRVHCDDAARLLRLEHARAVKVVNKLWNSYSIDNLPPEFVGNDRLKMLAASIYEQALEDVLTALQRVAR